MKATTVILSVLSFLSTWGAYAPASEFKITVKIDGRPPTEMFLKIEGDTATTKDADETEQFNLKDQSWLDPTTGNWVTLAECKKWVEESDAQGRKNVATAPDSIRAFLLWSLDPTFKVEKDK